AVRDVSGLLGLNNLLRLADETGEGVMLSNVTYIRSLPAEALRLADASRDRSCQTLLLYAPIGKTVIGIAPDGWRIAVVAGPPESAVGLSEVRSPPASSGPDAP